jgi:hypothetical protein
MRAVCPTDPRHERFATSAHVAQTWEVNPHGDFVSELESGEVTHGPDPGNIWSCCVCGAEATVYEDEQAAAPALAAAFEEVRLTELVARPLTAGPRNRLSGLAAADTLEERPEKD